MTVGAIHVHEFMSFDGVIDAPVWTFEYGFDPQMGEAIGAMTARSKGILLGRTTYQMFEPAWSTRSVEDDPGRAVLQRDDQERRLRHPRGRDLEQLRDHRALRRWAHPRAEGRPRRRPLCQRQRHAGPRDARRRPGRR